jgi:arabinofuranosyltransferase
MRKRLGLTWETVLHGLPMVLLLLHAVVWFRTAWVSDDAYISFRVVDNLLEGYGLRWNVADRTQVFTHPLWLFLLVPFAALSGEFYFAPLALSALCAAGALGLAWIATPPGWPRILVLLALLVSRAYVDFSSSGLENPLTHLLLAAFCAALMRYERQPWQAACIAFLAALALLNRLDLAPLLLPALAWVFLQSPRRRTIAAMAAAFAPLLAWEAFSLFYFGSLLPNTAHAKVFGAADTASLLSQGLRYLAHTARVDPPTLVALGGALALSLRGPAWARWVALGAMLQVVYTLRVGGDFMAGRFLTAPLLAATIAAAASPALRAPRRMAAATLCLVLAAWATPFPAFLAGADYGHQPGWVARGSLFRGPVLDERGVYYPHTGLLKVLRHGGHPIETWTEVPIPPPGGGSGVLVSGRIGLLGLRAGPAWHIVDPLALADPFLARLPARHAASPRPGHYPRDLPAGYLDTLRTGTNQIAAADLAALYDDLSLATRAPLFAPGRLGALWRLQRGASAAAD